MKYYTLKEVFDLDQEYDKDTMQGDDDLKNSPYLYGAKSLSPDPMYDQDNQPEEIEVPSDWEGSYEPILKWARDSGLKVTEEDLLNASDYWDVGVNDLTPGAIRDAMSASPKRRSDKQKANLQRMTRTGRFPAR